VSADLVTLEQVDQRYSYKFKSSKPLAAIKTFWNDLVKRTGTSTPETSYEQHRKLANLITDLIIVVGNDSYLILDPDVDSYYAMDATIFKIPGLVNQVSQLDSLATAALATRSGTEITPVRRAQIASGHAVTEEAMAALRSNLAYGLAANKEMEERLKPLIGYVDNAMHDYLEAIEHVSSASATLSAREVSALAARAASASFTLWDATLPLLDSLLSARIEHNSHRRMLSFLGVTLALMLSILLTMLIVGSITQPLRRLAEAAEKISMGDMAVELDVHGSDEIGELSQRFRRMQESLKVAMQQLGG
jgi:HAMP domain-containing protein